MQHLFKATDKLTRRALIKYLYCHDYYYSSHHPPTLCDGEDFKQWELAQEDEANDIDDAQEDKSQRVTDHRWIDNNIELAHEWSNSKHA